MKEMRFEVGHASSSIANGRINGEVSMDRTSTTSSGWEEFRDSPLVKTLTETINSAEGMHKADLFLNAFGRGPNDIAYAEPENQARLTEILVEVAGMDTKNVNKDRVKKLQNEVDVLLG